MPNTEAARKKIHIPSPGHGRTRPRHRTQTRFHQIRRSPQSYIPYWDYLHAPVLLIFLLWREKNMTEQEKRLHRCCFTGHRPQKLRRSEMEIKADLERAIKQVMRVRFLPYNSATRRRKKASRPGHHAALTVIVISPLKTNSTHPFLRMITRETRRFHACSSQSSRL